ncbi:DUF445 family protein [Clostridium sp.]|uniref:DUF445 family protein n=1 Tax=Clostridium sp. TaxID=1506 RepID=UPI002FC88ACE
MKYLIGALVGAVIGYITNWLAIKMLFRPYEEKKIFGIKIPFTPGLIPKERKRIAKSVGEAIGSHLLTKETILSSLCSEKINNSLSSWVEKEIKKLEHSESTVEENLKVLLNGHYEEISEDVRENIYDFITEGVKSKEFKEEVALLLHKEIKGMLSISPGSILSTEKYGQIKKFLVEGIGKNLNSNATKENVSKLLLNKLEEMKENQVTLEEIIPPSVVGNVKVYMYNKRYEIGAYIQSALKEEKYENKLKEIIGNVVSTQMNPMIAMFVNSDTIYNKIVDGVSQMLDNEENLVDLVLILNEVLSKVIQTKVADISENIPVEGTTLIGEKLWEVLVKNVEESNVIEEFIKTVEANITENKTLEDLLDTLNLKAEDTIVTYITDKINGLLQGNNVKGAIKTFINSALERVLNTRMKELFGKDGRDVSMKLSSITLSLYNSFIENKASDFIEIFDIAKVVEEKINEFEVTYAEEIILEIANKELNAITWLGAVLGGALGVLSPILSSFY